MPEVSIENLTIHITLDSEAAVGPFVAQSYEDIVDLFDEASDNGEAVRFVYEGPNNYPAQIRTITPSVIQSARDGEEAVLGHDHDRDAPRQFRLDRVTYATVADDVEPYRA